MSSKVDFYKLQWDTDFFGVECAKVILHEHLNEYEWSELSKGFKDYKFISIINRNSEPINAQLIGKNTSAFLADVNIQFIKKLENMPTISDEVKINNRISFNKRILDIADFNYSKFTEDPELLARGGHLVYKQWLINSFDKEDKYYALYMNEDKEITGVLLHSYKEDFCVVELIAVSRGIKKGIGSKLFKAVENEAFRKGFREIRVGTQVRNTKAVNFYHKIGFKQICSNQVYHLWNL